MSAAAVKHGSNGGYHQHRKLGQVPCSACCGGHAAKRRQMRAARQKRAAAIAGRPVTHKEAARILASAGAER